jgi:endoglucanase
MKGFRSLFADYRSRADVWDHSLHLGGTDQARDLVDSDTGFSGDSAPQDLNARAAVLDSALFRMDLHDTGQLVGLSHADLSALVDGFRSASGSADPLTGLSFDSVLALSRSGLFSGFRHSAESATTMPADQEAAARPSGLTHESLMERMHEHGHTHFHGSVGQPSPLPDDSQNAPPSPPDSGSSTPIGADPVDGAAPVVDGSAGQPSPLPGDSHNAPANPAQPAPSAPIGADPADGAAPVGSPSSPTPSSPTESHMLLGVNLAGGEFGSGRGTYGVDYTYPTDQEIDYYASKGLDVIRVPFLAERVQADANGPVNSDELSRLDHIAQYAGSKGMNVVLDMHNYGYIHGAEIGASDTATNAFADLWGKLAGHFADQPNVIFGLMNEPHDQSASQWIGAANAAIDSIRQAGATQEVLVPGSYWDGAWTWTTSDNASVVGGGVKDPANNFAFEVHQYLDSDGSGSHPDVVSATVGTERLQAVTQWAEATGNKLFLGEFGVSSDSTSLNSADAMLTYMQQHSDAWQGATYWAGGPWWGSYMYSIEPTNGADKPQMSLLTQHLGP